MKKKLKKLMNILLGIALVMGLVPEMGFTVYANDTKAYAAYDVTTEANKTKSGNELKELQVSFNGIPWYIIKDDSIAADEGTVTLLAADTSFGTCAFDDTSSSSSYGSSTVKKRLDELTETGSFKSMAKFIADTDLTDVNVRGAKLFLLSFQEADTLPAEVKKTAFTGENCEQGEWWTRSKDTDMRAICIVGGTGGGNIDNNSPNIANAYGVRPALRLDLSKVSFSEETREFSPDPAKFPYFYIVNTTTTVRFNNCDWYVIADDSTAVDAGTVTLLAKGTEFGMSAFCSASESNSYNNSDVKGYLEKIVSGTAGYRKPDFKGVEAAIQKVTLTTYKCNSTVVSETTNDAQMFLLSTEEAKALPEEILKSDFTDGWWLRSPGTLDFYAASVSDGFGGVNASAYVGTMLGVRPALKLNLSSVIFESESKTFSLKPYSVTLSGGANATIDGATSQTGLTGAMTTVTYTANTGYYFAEFADISSNGITARRTSSTVVTVSGTPTADATITVPDAAAIPTYEVTYKVVNGTWSDDTTTDKTETVQSGSTPANVPTGMKAASGYTGGSWDKNPAETTITGATTFTYTFTAKQAATVIKAPEAKTLTYNGSAKELVTAGVADGGTMQYALGTKDAATQPYTTSIPTATDAGTYQVWYMVLGDSDHFDTVPEHVAVTISDDKKENGGEENGNNGNENGNAGEKTRIDKVPLTDPNDTYPSSKDNFAPVSGAGKITKLVLDFSNVSKSDVKPTDLAMTVIAGSKLTTAAPAKDKASVKTEGGIKAKFSKKTGTVTVTCKKNGKLTLTMADGNTYTVSFTVEKPKARKTAKKLTKGSGAVTKTIHDLFGTDIDSGKLEILKNKRSQAALSGNALCVNPAEKDSIKVQYRYLNKKYKLAIKVK